jgi:NAD(P)-dependent dehydrogenase (short-subunit alcohol dehydrogenase family)
VEAFVREGAKVGVLERVPDRVQDLAKRLAEKGLAVQGDTTSLEDNEKAVAEVVSTFGQLDILVANAGIFDGFMSLVDFPKEKLSEAFDELFSVNVKSHLLSAKASVPELLKTEGVIIFTVSNAGFYPAGGGVLYTSSKFAVRGLVIELAYQLAPKIRVNGVAPGGTITDIRGLKAVAQDQVSAFSMVSPEEMKAFIQKTNPLGVLPTPEDHAWAYVYLASKEQARVVTGTIIHTDGGLGMRGWTKVAGML